MTNNPTVTVVIPNYNGEKFLKNCLESLNEQTYKEIEIILVDNNSTDMSLKLTQKYAPGSHIINLSKNTGFSYAVNEGIKKAKGEFIFLLNNDTECDKSCIQRLAETIKTDSRIFSVNSKMIQSNNRELIDDAGDGYCLLGLAYKRGYNQKVSGKTREKTIFSACAGASLYRKNILFELGLFDENFFAYLEDVDIGYRANIHGYKNIYCPKAIVYHVISGTTGIQKSEFKTKLSARNNSYLIYKNMPIIQLIINLPFLIIGILIKILFFAKHRLGSTYFINSFTAIKDFKKLTKTKFRIKNLLNYIKIQVMLIINCFDIMVERVKK